MGSQGFGVRKRAKERTGKMCHEKPAALKIVENM